jgi:uncharacterized protein (DUF1330 family)
MPAAYMIIGVDVHDEENFGPYVEQVPAMMAKYGETGIALFVLLGI